MAITARLARAWVAGVVGCLVLLGSATGALGAEPGAAVPRAGQTVPHPGSSSDLFGASCTSPGNCWAVGDYGNAAGAMLNQALHWNGRTWSRLPVPSPGGTAKGASSQLSGVACPSPASCWAVGNYRTSAGQNIFLNQALHWNGRRWSLAATPDPGRTAQAALDFLNGVRCTSASDCWAVGGFGQSGTGVDELNQALHWNGRTWSLVSTPDPGGLANGDANVLNGIRCPAPASCWAVGDSQASGGPGLNQVLHWNGSRWSAG